MAGPSQKNGYHPPERKGQRSDDLRVEGPRREGVDQQHEHQQIGEGQRRRDTVPRPHFPGERQAHRAHDYSSTAASGRRPTRATKILSSVGDRSSTTLAPQISAAIRASPDDRQQTADHSRPPPSQPNIPATSGGFGLGPSKRTVSSRWVSRTSSSGPCTTTRPRSSRATWSETRSTSSSRCDE